VQRSDDVTRNKDQKRIIRGRMQKTGESYTAARARVLSKPAPRQTRPPVVDYAALAGMSDAKVAAKTGRDWRQWVQLLDSERAESLPHRDIAALLHRTHGVPGWWAQTVTVGYERIKGLRQIGQRRGGAFEASKSRTFDVPVRSLCDAWIDDAVRDRWLVGVAATLRTANAPKSVRLQWPDGAIVTAWFTAKGPARSAVAVTHPKLPTKAAADAAKQVWADRLGALAALLGQRRRAAS
jgi:hypothetical protein